MELGKRILELRKKERISQEDLAEKIGVTRQTISNWELEQTSPDFNQAIELSKVFNVTLDELVGNNIDNILHKRTNNLEKKYEDLTDILKLIMIVFGAFILIVFVPLLLNLL